MSDLLPINTGRQQSSFKRFKITLQPGQVYPLVNPFNTFRCYGATLDFKVAWSTNSDFTDFGYGLAVKFVDVIPYAQIYNQNDSVIVVDVGVGIGDFDDSRLSVSGNISTISGQYSNFAATSYVVPESGVISVPATQKNIIQNAGSNVMRIGSQTGLMLQPQGVFEYSLDNPINVYGTAGDVLIVGSFS